MRSIPGPFESSQRQMAVALLVALTGSFISNGASAGPSVGDRMGSPTVTSTTVQARVVSSTPVVAQVSVPRDVCYDELQSHQAQPSGAGALLGAVAGAAVGNAVGKGSGRAVATGVGLIGGAILGNHIENRGRPAETRTVRRCEQQTSYENQVVAYNVVYELNGQRYSTQLPHEPGASIAVQMTVSPVTSVQSSQTYYAPPVVTRPVVQHVRYVSQPVVVRRGDKHHHHPRMREKVVYPVVYVPSREHDRSGRHWH